MPTSGPPPPGWSWPGTGLSFWIARSSTRSGAASRATPASSSATTAIASPWLPGVVAHHLAAGAAAPEVGEAVGLEIDWDRRYAHMRLHTALHVMSCVVVAPVTGGNISADKGRLDFDIDMTLLDAERIAAGTNELIARGVATETVWITDEELDSRPELVKTMSVQPPRGAGRIRNEGKRNKRVEIALRE